MKLLNIVNQVGVGVCVFFLATPTAMSAEWRDLVVGSVRGNGIAVLVDAESVKSKGRTTTAWVWYVFKKPITKGVDNYKSHETVDCHERTRSVEYVVYQYGNNLVDTQKMTTKEVTPIVPGTMESNVAEALCGKVYLSNPVFPRVDVPLFQKALPASK